MRGYFCVPAPQVGRELNRPRRKSTSSGHGDRWKNSPLLVDSDGRKGAALIAKEKYLCEGDGSCRKWVLRMRYCVSGDDEIFHADPYGLSLSPLRDPALSSSIFYRLSSHHGRRTAVRELLLFVGRRPAQPAVLNDFKPVSTHAVQTKIYTEVHARLSYTAILEQSPWILLNGISPCHPYLRPSGGVSECFARCTR